MKKRTLALALALALTILLGVAPASAAAPAEFDFSFDNVVETTGGKLLGVVADGTYKFLGVPYATAERFQQPVPAKWDGIKMAAVFGTVCPSSTSTLMTNVSVSEVWTPGAMQNQVGNEESCLNLNVWTQSLDTTAKKPVMVWFHGGGYSSGSSTELNFYDFTNMSKMGDVVCVSVNHRLNALGFLDVSAYGDKYENSVNAGMADAVCALEWVRDNIEKFGGDPDCVTIFGQSGGGGKVCTLMGIPSAKGLFHRAIAQSGNGVPNQDSDAAALVGRLTVEKLGGIEKAVSAPYADLVNAASAAMEEAKKQGKSWSYGPTANGDFIPYAKDFAEYTAISKDVPFMIGSNSGEFTYNSAASWYGAVDGFGINQNTGKKADENALKQLKEKYGDEKGAALAKEFQKAYPDKPLYEALYWDYSFRSSAMARAAEKASQGGAPVYQYVFTYEYQLLGGSTAWHNGEMPFAFSNMDTVDYMTYNDPRALALSDKMCQAWINFAYNGDPNHCGLPEWASTSKDKAVTMIFDLTSRVAVNHDAKLIELANSK